MKLALRLFCLASLLCASWAVVGADDKVKKTVAETLAERQSSATPKLNGATKPSAAASTGSSVAILAPPTSVAASPSGATPVVAQLTALPVEQPVPEIQLSHGTLAPTPEMWFYEQMRRDYDNPELQARRRGEEYAGQRRARMAAREWYGYSNSRPTAHVTPFMYYYSPSWSSNTANPFRWSGRTTTAVVVGLNGFGSW